MSYNDLLKTAFNIYKHYRSVYPEVKHYYGIIANYGLGLLAQMEGKESEPAHLLKEVLESFPDRISHPKYNFPSYHIGGIAKARAVYSGIIDNEIFRNQIREYAEEMLTAQRNTDGIMSMPSPDKSELVWIDVATAVTPFLLYAGHIFNEPRYIDEAVFQTLAMYDLFLDPDCGLLHQSKNFKGKDKLSEDHWSRGNGWGIFPLAELCAHLPDSHPEKSRCESYYKAHIDSLINFQSENGMWRQEITVKELNGLVSYEETSGTGLILYSIGVGIKNGILNDDKYIQSLRRGIEGLLKVSVSEDYSILNSCPGCLCPGDGSIKAYLSHKPPFIDEPHGAGPVIMALASAAENNIF
jgi:unsaturated rhamnogalacturonyl hydrolase